MHKEMRENIDEGQRETEGVKHDLERDDGREGKGREGKRARGKKGEKREKDG